MRTFTQKPKATQQTTSAKSAISRRAYFGQGCEVGSILHLQRTIGNQAVQRLLQANAEESGASLATQASTHFVHDFSQIPVHAKARPETHPKLEINTPGDMYEQEADRVAEQVMRMPEPKLQHACVCGGGCPKPKCQKEQLGQEHEHLQTKGIGSSELGQPAAPPIINGVLASSGQPLELATRAFFEPRFGHDFSRVRVHFNASAQQSAGDVNAHAYTVGHNIVFGAGRYDPRTHQSRWLIAHELAHVVQQRAGSTLVQRKVDVDDFEVDKFDQLPIRNYLRKIRSGEIEDDNDSDDKARFVVREWRRGKPMPLGPDEPDAKTKATLIREMQSGFTGDDDERAILALLLNSSDHNLEVIFSPGHGIDPKDLDSDFQGEEEDVLRAFYDRKFVGGRKSALGGSRKLVSQQAPAPRQAPAAQQAPAPIPTVQVLWRDLARKGVPFDQWPREQKQEADREYRVAKRRIWANQSVHDWLETRDKDNEIFRLLHPYYDELKDFFERSTYTRIESSANPVKSGKSVTFIAFVSLPNSQSIPTGEVVFTFLDLELRRIYGKDSAKKYEKKAALKDGKASVMIPLMIHPHLVEVTYPDSGDLIGSDASIKQEVTP